MSAIRQKVREAPAVVRVRAEAYSPSENGSSKTSANHIDELIPLTDSWFYTLWALAEGPTHGYAILQFAESLEKARVRMGTGTIYRHLPQMIQRELIENLEAPEEADWRRIYYRIIAEGHRVLAAQVRFMDGELRKVKQTIGGEWR